jgi:hypothetical protein
MTVGEMILIRAPQRQRAVDAARNLSARVAAVAARAWFMVVVGMAAPGVYGLTLRIQQAVARGVANYAQPIVENQLWRLRQYFADAGDEVGAARVDEVGEQIVEEMLDDAVQGIAGEVVTIVIAQARQEMADALVEVADDEKLVILSGTDEEMQEAQDVLAELPSLPPTPVRPQKQKIILVRQKHDIPEQGDMLETERISQRLYPKDEVIGLRFGQQVGYGRDGDTDWFEPTAILDISSDLVSAVTDLSRQFTTGGDQLQDLPNQFAMADEDTFFGGPQENVELGQVHEGPRGGDGGWEWRDASGLTPEQGNPWKFSTFYLNTDLEGQVTYDELYDVVLQALQDPTMTAPTDVPGRLLVVRKLIKTQLGLSSSDSKKVRNALAGMLDFRINLLQIIADFKQYWKDFAAWQAPQSTVVSESWATQEITGIPNEQQPPSDSTGAVVEDDWD